MYDKKQLVLLLSMNILLLLLIFGPFSNYLALMNNYPNGDLQVEGNEVSWKTNHAGDYILVQKINGDRTYRLDQVSDTVEIKREGEYLVEIVQKGDKYNRKKILDKIEIS